MISTRIFILFLLSLLSIVSSIKVSIYYEALCGDSMEFITRQLQPSYQKLSSVIDVEFIPYGKATQSKKNGKWRFQCQHGPQECIGNKYQACALSQENGEYKDVKYISCVMNSYNPASTITLSECATNANIDFEEIKTCAKGKLGNDLLAYYGDKTHAVEPRISFVPTIIFDDVYNEDLHYDSFYNFHDTVCSLINGTKPSSCQPMPYF